MKQQELTLLAEELAQRARGQGCRGVIVALSFSDEEHSYYSVRFKGPCLEVEGLLQRVKYWVGCVWPPTSEQASRAEGAELSREEGEAVLAALSTLREPSSQLVQAFQHRLRRAIERLGIP